MIGNVTVAVDRVGSANAISEKTDMDLSGLTANAAGDIELISTEGSIAMVDGTQAVTNGTGDILFQAAGDIGIGVIQSNGDVILTAAGGSISDQTQDEMANITAKAAILTAMTGIGAEGAADIDTSVDTISAVNTAANGIFIDEKDGLTLMAPGVKTLGGNGDILIGVETGDLYLTEEVAAHGTGGVTMNVLDGIAHLEVPIITGNDYIIYAPNGPIRINQPITSHGGEVILTGADVKQDADITTTGDGKISVLAETGSILMAGNATSTSGSGGILYQAAEDVYVTQLSTTGDAKVVAGAGDSIQGAIVDVLSSEQPNIIADRLTLIAETGIGKKGGNRDVDIHVNELTARNLTANDISLQETDGLVLGSSGIVNRGESGFIDIDIDQGDFGLNGSVRSFGYGDITINADKGKLYMDFFNTVVPHTGEAYLTGHIVGDNGVIPQYIGTDRLEGETKDLRATVDAPGARSKVAKLIINQVDVMGYRAADTAIEDLQGEVGRDPYGILGVGIDPVDGVATRSSVRTYESGHLISALMSAAASRSASIGLGMEGIGSGDAESLDPQPGSESFRVTPDLEQIRAPLPDTGKDADMGVDENLQSYLDSHPGATVDGGMEIAPAESRFMVVDDSGQDLQEDADSVTDEAVAAGAAAGVLGLRKKWGKKQTLFSSLRSILFGPRV